jgi:predicted short-subunit dehydrogenase-like oxidoreductase (DUF2520 family)
MTPVLNIIGPGRVGRTLGALLARKGLCTVQDVLSAEFATADAAVAFIGAGRAVRKLADMRPATLWLLTPPDGAIASMASALAATGNLRAGDVVFHCSGAQPASILAPLASSGAQLASVHPLKSFAEPGAAVESFAGTWCTVEGDAAALALLRPLFEQLGARVAQIDPAGKTLYHAASVLVCNDLTALMEAGLRAYEAAGLDRATAQAMIEPLVRETLDNVFALGTVRALTGPVARGDAPVVVRQLEALGRLDLRIADAYRALNAIALDLARTQGGAPAAALDAVAAALDDAQRKQQ